MNLDASLACLPRGCSLLFAQSVQSLFNCRKRERGGNKNNDSSSSQAMQQQPATPPPTLNVQLPTPSGFSAHRARSQTVNDTERPDEIKVHGRSPSLNTASALQDVITQGPKSARRAAPPTPLALSKQHTPSALLSPYDSPRAGKHTPRHSISGVLPSAGLRHEAARQRGLSIAVVKHGENQVVMTPGLPSGALKSASLKSAGIVPIQSAKPGQVSAPPSARKESECTLAS